MRLKDKLKRVYQTYKKQDLYTRVLIWAYRKQETGFTHKELVEAFNLTQAQDAWVWKIFNTVSDNDRKLFEHLRNDEKSTPNQHYYALNEKGITSAINYLSLRQSERNSRLALLLTFASVLLAVISINLTREAINIQVEGNKISEFASRGDRIQQIKLINEAVSYCKENPNADDSGLDNVSTGEKATCKQTLEIYPEGYKF